MRKDRPPYGTELIRCGKIKCKWRGLETELAHVPHKNLAGVTNQVCPACGCDSYMFMTVKEIAAYDRAKTNQTNQITEE